MNYPKAPSYTKILTLVVWLLLLQIQSYSRVGDTTNQKPATVPVAADGKKDTAKKNNPAPGGNNKPNPSADTSPTVAQVVKGAPEVINVQSTKTTDDSSVSAGISDNIIIKVRHFDSLIRLAKANNRNISLYIDGKELTSIPPPSGAPDQDSGSFRYQLDRNTTNDKIWADILGSPAIGDEFFKKPVKVSVGLKDDIAIRISDASILPGGGNFKITRIHKGWFWACSVIIIIYLFVFIYLAQKQGLLRDRRIDLRAIGIRDTTLQNPLSGPYSLGRCQMAFWFTLTVISFLFIWLITDAFNIISTTVLALIGISTATSLSAAVIDNSKNTDLLNQTIALQNEVAQLDNDIAALKEQIKALPAGSSNVDLQSQLSSKQAKQKQNESLIENNKATLTPGVSRGFLTDVLSDVNGVSFHRLQMFVWTFVLGLIFLYSVWKRLSMPEFDATLLALQGITAGTYLGFKFPEKQA